MKQIQPITIWINGEEKVGEYISVTGTYDNNESKATEYWQIYTIDNIQIANGNVEIDGQNYQDWGNQPASNVNVWIYNWVASQINVVIL